MLVQIFLLSQIFSLTWLLFPIHIIFWLRIIPSGQIEQYPSCWVPTQIGSGSLENCWAERDASDSCVMSSSSHWKGLHIESLLRGLGCNIYFPLSTSPPSPINACLPTPLALCIRFLTSFLGGQSHNPVSQFLSCLIRKLPVLHLFLRSWCPSTPCISMHLNTQEWGPPTARFYGNNDDYSRNLEKGVICG